MERRKDANRKMRRAVDQLTQERVSQIEVYGDEHKSPEEWIAILSKQLGKAAMECPVNKGDGWNKDRLIQRLVQAGATFIAAIEDIA